MTLLTIVTVTFKDPKGLSQTIESLKPLLLSGIQWEHVVVDSSPAANETVLGAVPRDWPLKRIQEAPRGIYAAMNTGAQNASGTVLWFLNGGDKLGSLEALKKILTEIEQNAGLDVVLAAVDLYRAGKFLYPVTPKHSWSENLIGSNHICHQGVFYRRTAFLKVGLYDSTFALAADYDHHIRCMLAQLKMHHHTESVVHFDMAGVSSQWSKVLKEYRSIQKKFNRQFSLQEKYKNFYKYYLESFRVHTVKAVSESAIGERLRPVWIFWNRLKKR